MLLQGRYLRIRGRNWLLCVVLALCGLALFLWSSPRDVDIGAHKPDATLSALPPLFDSVLDPIKHSSRANATLFMLARNSDIESALHSIKQLEERFNRKYHYSWVFLNDVEFTQEFKIRISEITSGGAHFGLIPREHWDQPDWIDEDKASAYRKLLVDKNIVYGDSVTYRNMCRFNSGFFYRHELLLPYRWYWRVEPGVDFPCNVDYDPFHYMQDYNKTYGWTIAPYDFRETVATLWNVTQEFINQNPDLVAPDNAARFVTDNKGQTYNLCHFWSNFEIADMDFYRGHVYSAYFSHLDASGGFYYERWGDAPVHTIAATHFLPKSALHFFDDIGYRHHPFQHCPQGKLWEKGNCSCSQWENFDKHGYSCKWRWNQLLDPDGLRIPKVTYSGHD